MASAQREFRRRIDALDGIFRFLDEFALAAGLDDRSKSRLGLVVEELFTNMVRHNHGAGHDIGIRLERCDRRLHLELTDDDVEPFDPDTVPVPDVSGGLDTRRPGGLGIHLVRSMVDELTYISSAGLGLLFATHKRLVNAGGGLRLTNLNPHISEVFQIAGFHHIFSIEETSDGGG